MALFSESVSLTLTVILSWREYINETAEESNVFLPFSQRLRATFVTFRECGPLVRSVPLLLFGCRLTTHSHKWVSPPMTATQPIKILRLCHPGPGSRADDPEARYGTG